MMIGIADAIVMAPVLASACSTPTEAEDDWIIAVNTAPASTPRIGFENRSSRLRKLSLVRSGETAPLIAFYPKDKEHFLAVEKIVKKYRGQFMAMKTDAKAHGVSIEELCKQYANRRTLELWVDGIQ